jgi:hypothetical protein
MKNYIVHFTFEYGVDIGKGNEEWHKGEDVFTTTIADTEESAVTELLEYQKHRYPNRTDFEITKITDPNEN